MDNLSHFLPELLIMHEFGHMSMRTMVSKVTHGHEQRISLFVIMYLLK